jgi:hypothetical protein
MSAQLQETRMKHRNEKPSRLPAATTRHYPRTLQEAFGPHTNSTITVDDGFRWTPVRKALFIAYVAALVALFFVLPGGAP